MSGGDDRAEKDRLLAQRLKKYSSGRRISQRTRHKNRANILTEGTPEHSQHSGKNRIAWLNELVLGKNRWDWITRFFMPAAGVAILLLGIGAVSQEIEKNRTQVQANATQHALQKYLTTMSILVAEHNLSQKSPYDSEGLAATTLTRHAIAQFTSDTNSETLLCSLDVQYCASEKSAVIEALAEFRLFAELPRELNDTESGVEASERQVPPSVSLANLDLRNINAEGLLLRRANLRRTDLTGSILKEASLRGADLVDTDLSGTDLSGAILRDADMWFANLVKANMEEADLIGTDLLSATLREANLNRAFLLGANLSGADLRRANLERANLLSANLERADLRGVNLRGTNLTRANLDRTNLQGALYTDENSACPGIWINDFLEPEPCFTQFPEGFDPEQAGLILWTPEN